MSFAIIQRPFGLPDMKKLFAVVLYEPNAEVEERLFDAYAQRHKYTDTFYLVSTEPSVVSDDIAEAVGLKGDNRIEHSSGAVFKMNSAFSGYTQRSLWEWLESVIDHE